MQFSEKAMLWLHISMINSSILKTKGANLCWKTRDQFLHEFGSLGGRSPIPSPPPPSWRKAWWTEFYP
jgi:hypothetical protein